MVIVCGWLKMLKLNNNVQKLWFGILQSNFKYRCWKVGKLNICALNTWPMIIFSLKQLSHHQICSMTSRNTMALISFNFRNHTIYTTLASSSYLSLLIWELYHTSCGAQQMMKILFHFQSFTLFSSFHKIRPLEISMFSTWSDSSALHLIIIED